MSLNFSVNGQPYTVDCSPGSSLLSLLRQMGWTSPRRVCDSGDCGSCTVWVEGAPVHSCLFPAMRAESCQVTTLEGLAVGGDLTPMQQAFLAKQGFQCGFCTTGMIMSATQFTYESEADLRQMLRGNLCRCTGYAAIVESITCDPQLETAIAPDTINPLGQSIPKQDGPAIATGQPLFAADTAPAGLLHLKVLRSPHPHALIRRISTEQAKALPGVHAIFTHEDVPRRPYTTAGHMDPVPDPLDHYLLDHKVRFIGDRVAAVVADSVAIAEQACQLIDVEYELLPHVIDPREAMGVTERQGPIPLLHDEPDSQQIYDVSRNLAGVVALESGNVADGFAAADLIVENTYILPAVQHAHLEPHITTSWLDLDGTLVVHSSTQVPFHCQRILSEIFDLPREQIRVYKTKLGGGFGNKQEILSEDLCALATLKTGKPVRWEFTRTEEFTATSTRHAMTIRMKTGVLQDGTLVAQEIEAIANTGAYGNHGQTVVFLAGYIPLGLYRCPHKHFQGYAVYTNTVPAGAFRGYGATQGTFAIESQMDDIAHQLRMDPVELRRKNLIRPGDSLSLGPADDHFNLIGGYTLDACFKTVLDELGYTPEPLPATQPGWKRGMGLAVSMQGSGLAKIHTAAVSLSLEPTGRFLLRTGSVDLGTGSETTLRQIAAQVLGVSIAEIDILTGDTHRTPFDAGAYASSTIYISGQAVKGAAEQLQTQLVDWAATVLAVDPDQVMLGPQGVKTADQGIAFQNLAERAGAEGRSLTADFSYHADESTLTFAVEGVDVEVDPATGQVQVLRSVQAIDLGTAINPRICRGQATGGTVMGLGYALMEELLLDDRGQIQNPGFRYYRIPTAADVPPMQVFFVESTDPYGPFGAKGVGEVTTNCIAPAIANAIAHATGVRLRQLPMTPERVWRALQSNP